MGYLSAILILGFVQDQGFMAKQPPILASVRDNNIEQVKAMLKQGENPNGREVLTEKPSFTEGIAGGKTYPGDPALSIAVDQKTIAMVTLLLNAKADVNQKGVAGFTALMNAARTDGLEMVKLLLHRGAKPNIQNEYGDTAIIFAANLDLVRTVETLLNAGADINGGSGQTPLMIACQCGSTQTVKLLLKRGADPNFRRKGYLTCLEYSYQSYDEEIRKMLVKARAKGRTKAAVDKETSASIEKYRKEFAKRRASVSQISSTETSPTPDDFEVFEAVANDMLTDTKGRSEVSGSEGTSLYISEIVSRDTNSFEEGQINSELTERQACDLTLDIRKSFFTRNASNKPFLIRDHEFSNPNLLVRDLSKAGGLEMFSMMKKDHSKGWVRFNCPGYSVDGRLAMVRLSDGPSAHGASGTYFLTKVDGKWKVTWRDFAHYY